MRDWIFELNLRVVSDRWKRVANEAQVEARSIQMRANMEKIWSELRRTGMKMGVCSNLTQAYGSAALEALPDGPDVKVLSYETGYAKPDGEIYDRVVSDLRCEPDQILFVGDTPETDIVGPQRLGMAAMHVQRFEWLFSPSC